MAVREHRSSLGGPDVCLILEGTYPYVAGGVSTWVHELIRGLPNVRFALAHIGPARGVYPGMQYALPSNLEAPSVRLLAGLGVESVFVVLLSLIMAFSWSAYAVANEKHRMIGSSNSGMRVGPTSLSGRPRARFRWRQPRTKSWRVRFRQH